MTATAEFARRHYPNISDELIKRNLLEIQIVLDDHRQCASCHCLDMCEDRLNTAGYCPVLYLAPAGYMTIDYAACKHNPKGVIPKALDKRSKLKLVNKKTEHPVKIGQTVFDIMEGLNIDTQLGREGQA